MTEPRRIVTGHDEQGRGVVTYDGPAPAIRLVADGASFYDMWLTASSPAPVTATEPEPIMAGQMMGPPAGGTRVRMVDMPAGTRSPMHRTESIDYGVVIEGTITMVLDGGEAVEAGPGTLLVQRGTSHAWENRGSTTTRLLFVLVAGSFSDELSTRLPHDAVTYDVD